MEKPHFSKMLAFMPTKIRKIQILFFGITQQIHPQKHAVIPHFPFPRQVAFRFLKLRNKCWLISKHMYVGVLGWFVHVCPSERICIQFCSHCGWNIIIIKLLLLQPSEYGRTDVTTYLHSWLHSNMHNTGWICGAVHKCVISNDFIKYILFYI